MAIFIGFVFLLAEHKIHLLHHVADIVVKLYDADIGHCGRELILAEVRIAEFQYGFLDGDGQHLECLQLCGADIGIGRILHILGGEILTELLFDGFEQGDRFCSQCGQKNRNTQSDNG